jgi:poly-gamma-glutamate synthesis protein (capsule biosynthesis protein)
MAETAINDRTFGVAREDGGVGGPARKHAARRAPEARRRLAVAAAGASMALAVLGVGAAIALRDDDTSSGAADASTTVAGDDSTQASLRTTTTPSTAPPRDPVLGSGQAIVLAFAGDSNFEGSAAARLETNPASVFAPVAEVLAAADLAVVNMETAIGEGGTPADKEFTFQAPATALEAFRAAGVDVVSAANNHGVDYGEGSLQETLEAERATGFPIIGIGANETEAYAPWIAEVKGQRIAVLAATQVLDDHLIDAWTATPTHAGLASAKRVDRLVQAVAEARAQADTVVVFLHWGVERETCPSTSQRELAARLVEAGADVIVGGHAHRLQGGGMLGPAVVHYGLGNFGFAATSTEGAQSGIFLVTITGRRVDGYEWVPARIVDRQPRLLEGEERAAAVERWNELRACTDLT